MATRAITGIEQRTINGLEDFERQLWTAAAAFNANPEGSQPTITLTIGSKTKDYRIVVDQIVMGLTTNPEDWCEGIHLTPTCKHSHVKRSVDWVVKKLIMDERGLKGEIIGSALKCLPHYGFVKLLLEEGLTQNRAEQIVPYLYEFNLLYILEDENVKAETAAKLLAALLSPIAPHIGEAERKAVRIFDLLMERNVRGNAKAICNALKSLKPESFAYLASNTKASLWSKLFPGSCTEDMTLALRQAPKDVT